MSMLVKINEKAEELKSILLETNAAGKLTPETMARWRILRLEIAVLAQQLANECLNEAIQICKEN